MLRKKLSVEEQKEIFPDDELREVFLQRKDIAILPPDEQEARWQQQLEAINSFMEVLADIPAYVMSV